MNRIIRFRGKSINNGQWVYGLLRMRLGMPNVIIESENGLGVDIDPKTIGEFTNRTDKNQKDIYEGDIVKDYTTDTTWSVNWSDEDGGWGDSNNHPHYSLFKSLEKSFEVIGNIYDSPELLK